MLLISLASPHQKFPCFMPPYHSRLTLLKLATVGILLLLVIASSKAQTLTDGPYIFEEEDGLMQYTIKDGTLEKQPLPDNRMLVTFQVATDEADKTFEVSLKPGLSYELSSYEMPEKLLAISDIEGNFGQFLKLLQQGGVIDEDLNWRFGAGHLVLTGDFFDRGDMVTEVLWLIYKLEWEAMEAGGHVHFVLGNHEIMNLQGDFRYVHPKYKKSAELMGKELSDLYARNTELGQWLMSKNMVEKVGDHLFVHAGISQAVNELGLTVERINSLTRPYLDLDAYNAEEDVKTLLSGAGPLWYRGYYQGGDIPMVVNQTLQQFNVHKIITGHTVVADTISTHYDGKVINIDTPHARGKSEALLIENGMYYRLNIKGDRTLLPGMKPKNLAQPMGEK